jgi:hypothetical protein
MRPSKCHDDRDEETEDGPLGLMCSESIDQGFPCGGIPFHDAFDHQPESERNLREGVRLRDREDPSLVLGHQLTREAHRQICGTTEQKPDTQEPGQ